MLVHAPRRSGKSPVLIVALLAIVAGAVILGLRLMGGNSADAGMEKYDAAMGWKQRFSRHLVNDEAKRFTRVQLGVNRDDSEKADHSIDILGFVQTQADLDALNALLKQTDFTPPIRHNVAVKLDNPSAKPPTPAEPAKPAAGGPGA